MIKQHHGLNDLVRDFSNAIQKPTAAYIDLNLEHEDAFDREATGVYKLIPYYMKIYPQDINHGDRFIIQQNPFNGEFQLVKIFNYIYRKNVRSLFHPNKEIPQKKDLTKINTLQKYQANVKALVEKNKKSEKRVDSIIQEITKTKEKYKYLQENLQTKQNIFHEKIKTEEKRIKQKELNIEKNISQLELKNLQNEKNIYDCQKTLALKQSIIDEQKLMIEKLKLEISQLKYESNCQQDDNLNLMNHLKNTKENLNQEKGKNKEFEKEKKRIHKQNEKNTTNLTNLSNKIQETEKEMKEHKMNNGRFTLLLEKHYYYFTHHFQAMFISISDLERKFRLKIFINDSEFYREDPDYNYERALINYGTFIYVEKARKAGMIHIHEDKIFDPKKLE